MLQVTHTHASVQIFILNSRRPLAPSARCCNVYALEKLPADPREWEYKSPDEKRKRKSVTDGRNEEGREEKKNSCWNYLQIDSYWWKASPGIFLPFFSLVFFVRFFFLFLRRLLGMLQTDKTEKTENFWVFRIVKNSTLFSHSRWLIIFWEAYENIRKKKRIKRCFLLNATINKLIFRNFLTEKILCVWKIWKQINCTQFLRPWYLTRADCFYKFTLSSACPNHKF